MAISLVNNWDVESATSGVTTSITQNSAMTHLGFFLGVSDITAVPTSCTWGGVHMTSRLSVLNASGGGIYYYDIPTPVGGQTADHVLTLSSSTDWIGLWIDWAGTLDYSAGATNSGTGTALTVTLAASAGCEILDCGLVYDAASPATLLPGAGQTDLGTFVKTSIRTRLSNKKSIANMAQTAGSSQPWSHVAVRYSILPIEGSASLLAYGKNTATTAGATVAVNMAEHINVAFHTSESFKVGVNS